MKLLPRERGKLLLAEAGQRAQARLSRGLLLNHPEAAALIAMQVAEMAREGRSVAELMDLGRRLLGRRQVMLGVEHMLDVVQVEATFPDGTKLVTVDHPIEAENGDMEMAFHGSAFPAPNVSLFRRKRPVKSPFVPGETIVDENAPPIEINANREKIMMVVKNLGDRPIQVGSHYHFTETNRFLQFDRVEAVGYRLDILSGTAVRFEPGEEKTVRLCRIAGRQRVFGGNNLVDGPTDNKSIENARKQVAERVKAHHFSHQPQEAQPPPTKKQKGGDGENRNLVTRRRYAEMYGPTEGDLVRLGNTSLFVRVEKDHTVHGDEVVFGGGKVLREGMGMAVGESDFSQILDLVITNVLVLDYTGVFKADVGVKDGKISGIGKAGNPDTMAGVTPGMIVGVHTEAIAGERLILTAGGFDAHIHFICPQIIEDAICTGLTTLLGGGTGPATGTNATTCTPGPGHIKMMLQATDAFPMNFGFTGKGNASKPEGLKEVIQAGAVGLKLHEDWGTTPASIDVALTVAEEMDVQIMIHTDTLNESACCEDSIAAFKGRTIHTYHSEGAGGGHAPDIIRVCGEKAVIPSSTNPTRPFTKNTIDEHLDMLMVCHHLHKDIKEDVAFAESRIRAETIAAEDILHDMGAISIISSDSQAMGRVGEVITRTWQTADKMKLQRGRLPEEESNEKDDNSRVKRYISKYTINPAIAHGMSHLIGSIEVGKIADLCLWKPAFFGAKPEIVIKAGAIAYAQMGDANASVPTCEPIVMQPMFAAYGQAIAEHSITFVSQAAVAADVKSKYGLRKRVEAIKNCRNVNKTSMKHNSTLPEIKVDPEKYHVTANGELLTCEPIDKASLAQEYNLF